MTRACVLQKSNLETFLAMDPQASRRFAFQVKIFHPRFKCLHKAHLLWAQNLIPSQKYKSQKKTLIISPIIQGPKENLDYLTHYTRFKRKPYTTRLIIQSPKKSILKTHSWPMTIKAWTLLSHMISTLL